MFQTVTSIALGHSYSLAAGLYPLPGTLAGQKVTEVQCRKDLPLLDHADHRDAIATDQLAIHRGVNQGKLMCVKLQIQPVFWNFIRQREGTLYLTAVVSYRSPRVAK